MRIRELGQELNVDNKSIAAFLNEKGVKGSLTPNNSVPEEWISAVREHFSSTSGAKSGPPKAVALPDSILKKVEAEAEAKAVKDQEVEKKKEEAKLTEKAKDVPPQKKKKIIAVFNPQHAQSDRGRSIGRNGRPEKNHGKEQQPAKGPIKPRVPARDHVPDDEKAVKKVLPSQVRPARDRIPDDELREMELKKQQELQEAKERAAAEAAEAEAAEAAKKEQEAAEAKAAAAKAEKAAEPQPAKAEPEMKAEPAPAAKAPESRPESTQSAAPSKAPEEAKSTADSKGTVKGTADAKAGKPRESEAIKSLREKIVKGTVSVADLQVTKRSSSSGSGGRRDGGDRQQGGRKGQERTGGRPGSRPGQGQNDRQQGGQGQGQGQGRPGGKNRTGAAPSAPVMNDNRGKGKGGRNQKGKFEKQGGDKFDRFENEKGLQKKQTETKVKQEEEIKVITLPDTITLKEFAEKLKMQPAALIKKLFLQGKVLTVNDILDYETAEAIALDMDIICEHEEVIDYIEELLKEDEEDESKLIKRPPVVCVMGHVDHGKTSLLDAIRNTNVIAKEAGGITQHIGAYQVTLPSGDKITFLDTPGHEAFTAMRLRGAMATDVAILVVAADDGVMPQTIEAINHAKAAGIHVIVAVNKIDKPGANIDKVKQELSDQGLIPEDWGGDTIFCPVSAKTGEGIEELLEMVILDTEILELKADPNRKARGLVIEAKLDKGRGSVATLLVQKGTLKVGDHIAMGEAYGKVRSMTNADGQRVKEAGPSVPVEITGMNGVPNAGEVFVAYDSDKEAKAFAQVFIEENKKKLLAGTKSKMNLEDVFDQMKAGDVKDLELIIKADVQGSVGALKESLEKLSNDEVNVRVIHSGVGNVNESDAILASASNAIIIAFNVNADSMATAVIEHEKVDLRKYSVIYSAIDDVELAIRGMLKPVYEEVITGHVEIRQIFKSSSTGSIAGSYVTDGVVKRDSKIRLMRGSEQVYDGSISTLKRFADDVKEVKSGYECGITLKDFQDFREGDTMEAYEMKEVPRK